MIPGYKLTKKAAPRVYNLNGEESPTVPKASTPKGLLSDTRLTTGDYVGYDFYHKQYPKSDTSPGLYANRAMLLRDTPPEAKHTYIGDTYYDGLKSYNASVGVPENDPRMKQPQPRKWYQKIFSPVADPVPASPEQQSQWNRAYRRHNWKNIPDTFLDGPVHK